MPLPAEGARFMPVEIVDSEVQRAPLLGRRVVFLTCHDKTRLVSEPLAALGFTVESLTTYNTDHFGTFSREVGRTGSAEDTVLAKAKLAADLGGARYGLGSEGSFGRDPHIGWMPWVKNGVAAGTTGRGLPIEAVEMRLESK